MTGLSKANGFLLSIGPPFRKNDFRCMPDKALGKPSSTGRRFSEDFFGLLGAWSLGLFAVLVPFLIYPRFYFNDDQQNQYYAYFIDIGQHLRHHQWPGLTLSTFYGGNLIDDWQFGLFNPVSLLIDWLVSPMQNLLLLGLVIYGIYLSLFSLGAYGLGRVFGLTRGFSLCLSACLVMNNYLQYMYCDTWIPGLVSFTWFIWIWVLLEQYRKKGHGLVLAGLIGLIYLMITSGWPHTMLMLGALMFGYLVELIFVQRLWARALKLVLANLGALMVTAPFLLPALLSYSWMTRPSGIHSSGFLMPDLGSVLNLSSIFYFPRIRLYSHEYSVYPMMYLAWFILPLLPVCSWSVAVETLRNRLGLIVLAAASLLMLFGPETLGPLRYPIRFLPFVHVTILLAFLLVISAPGIFQISRPRLAGVLAILFVQFTASVSVVPDTIYLQIVSSGCSLIMIFAALRLIYYKNLQALSLLFLSGTLFVFIATHLVSLKNFDQADFNSPTQNNTSNPTVGRPFSGYQAFVGPMIFDNSKDVRFAAQGIYTGAYTLNGYSSLGHTGLCPRIHGYTWFEMRDTAAIDFLFSQEPTTNRSMLSLMRVNRLLIFNDYMEYARPLLSKNWISTSKGEYATAFENAAPDRSLTTLSFASDGIAAKSAGEVTGEREQLQITSNPNGGQLVFARLFWPGYEAHLNGTPVPVSPLDQILVKVDLPPGAQGQLELLFIPPGFRLGLVLAALGAILCCATLFFSAREPRAHPA